nr:hypothetical protein B11B22.100 [imported] - Neurospora crassa [Neurospora crassa]
MSEVVLGYDSEVFKARGRAGAFVCSLDVPSTVAADPPLALPGMDTHPQKETRPFSTQQEQEKSSWRSKKVSKKNERTNGITGFHDVTMPVYTGAHALWDSGTGANIDVIRMAVFLKDEAVDTPLRQVSEGVCTTLNRGYAITHYGKLASAPLPSKHADTIRALKIAIEAAFH